MNIAIFFDGTGNTIENTEQKAERTNIRRAFDLVSLDSDILNVSSRVLSGVECMHAECGGAGSHALYLEGISGLRNMAEGIGVLDRVRGALEFVRSVYKPGDHIQAYGFSRGAASAVLFAKYVSKQGINRALGDASPQNIDIADWLRSDKYQPRYANEDLPNPITHLTLIDTVFASKEVRSVLDKQWLLDVDGTAGTVTHFLSTQENRNSFEPFIFNKPALGSRTTLKQEPLDGSHSDIGGLYRDSALGLPTFMHIIKEIGQQGIPYNKAEALGDTTMMSDNALKLEGKKVAWRLVGLRDRKLFFNLKVAHNNNKSVDPRGSSIDTYFSDFYLVPKRDIEELLRDKHSKGDLNSRYDLSDLDLSHVPREKLIAWKLGDINKFPGMVIVSQRRPGKEYAFHTAAKLKILPGLFHPVKRTIEAADGIVRYIRRNNPSQRSEFRLHVGDPHDFNPLKPAYLDNVFVRRNLTILRDIQIAISKDFPESASKLEQVVADTFQVDRDIYRAAVLDSPAVAAPLKKSRSMRP